LFLCGAHPAEPPQTLIDDGVRLAHDVVDELARDGNVVDQRLDLSAPEGPASNLPVSNSSRPSTPRTISAVDQPCSRDSLDGIKELAQ